jgi:hypothetical protein
MDPAHASSAGVARSLGFLHQRGSELGWRCGGVDVGGGGDAGRGRGDSARSVRERERREVASGWVVDVGFGGKMIR